MVIVAPLFGAQAEPRRSFVETGVAGIGPGLPIVERVFARRPRAIVGYDQPAEARAIWVRCDFQRDSAAKGMRDDRRSYRPLEQSGRLGPGQELRQMNLRRRSEEHTSELQSLMRSSYAVFCLKK